MSFREEDKEKEKGGLGTGFAVVATIGVGIGAALYYFINKGRENPTAAGSTAQGWTCDSPHTLNNQFNSRDNEAFRERSWSLEECSICCDVVLRDQEIMSLPCTHNFHTKCILPWLQEHQTCPNCRKPID
nr:probable E3 ubiquitin-protein ligase RHY1A isoform X1 [Vanessa tameamea]